VIASIEIKTKFLRFVNLFKDVLEAAVIALEDGVLGAHVKGPALFERHLEGRVGEVADGLVRVVHAHDDAARLLEGENLEALGGAALGSVHQLDEAGLVGHEVSRLVLVAVSVAADDDGLRPAGHHARDVLADDRLAEHGAAQNVADRAVRGWPHLLQFELCCNKKCYFNCA
jgi:hypothetical protein